MRLPGFALKCRWATASLSLHVSMYLVLHGVFSSRCHVCADADADAAAGGGGRSDPPISTALLTPPPKTALMSDDGLYHHQHPQHLTHVRSAATDERRHLLFSWGSTPAASSPLLPPLPLYLSWWGPFIQGQQDSVATSSAAVSPPSAAYSEAPPTDASEISTPDLPTPPPTSTPSDSVPFGVIAGDEQLNGSEQGWRCGRRQVGIRYRGDTVGRLSDVSDSAECCVACQMNLLCNAWVFCGKKGGCSTAHGAEIPESMLAGRCELKCQAGYDYLGASPPDAYPHDGAWVSGVIYKELPIQNESGDDHAMTTAPREGRRPQQPSIDQERDVKEAERNLSSLPNESSVSVAVGKALTTATTLPPAHHKTTNSMKPLDGWNSSASPRPLRQDVLELLYSRSAVDESESDDELRQLNTSHSERPLRLGAAQSSLRSSAAPAAIGRMMEEGSVAETASVPAADLLDATVSAAHAQRVIVGARRGECPRTVRMLNVE